MQDSLTLELKSFVNAKNNIKQKRIWTLFLPISQTQYGQHLTHSSWSCHILVICGSRYKVLWVYCNKNATLLYSNAEIGPADFHHSSLMNLKLLPLTMKIYGHKCIWKLAKHPFHFIVSSKMQLYNAHYILMVVGR